MLTLKVITPKQAENYYNRENFYSQDEEFEQSQWLGNGAKQLKLRGAIAIEDYNRLCNGKVPNGKVFRKKRNESLTRNRERAGVDCTLSAPKSVSLLALVKGDRAVIKAHRKAVEKTMAIAEKRYAATRVVKGEVRKPVKTENLTIATYHHDTSRELDPHLHTHCVVMNLTQLPSGKWQSLYGDGLFKNRRLLDQIYQNELAIELQKLGYRVQQQEHGGFEVVGFEKEDLEYFSKRRQQIIKEVGEIKNSTWAEREKAWAATRMNKGEAIPRMELMAYWQSEAESIDLKFPEPTQEKILTNKSLDQLLKDAIAHCSERAVSFSRKGLEGFILTAAGFKYKIEQIEAKINHSEELLYLTGDEYTTQSAIDRELATIKLMKEGVDKFAAITTPEAIAKALKDKSLTQGQKEAIVLCGTNKDRVIAWQGDAGVGKTYALRQFKETISAFKGIANANGYEIVGFAPSAAAAKVLGDELEIETSTVARKLVTQDASQIKNNQIWVVDEAGLLSASAALNLFKKAKAENARVILVGDTKQLSAVEAGNPFKSLQNHGLKTAHLTESLRQKVPDLQRSVELAARGEIERAIANLKNHGRIKYQAKENLCERIVEDYLSLEQLERDRTLILAGTNANRATITDAIRAALKKSGDLSEARKITQLVPKDLTKVQSQYAHNFKIGEFVQPIRNLPKRGLQRNQLYRVIGLSTDKIRLQKDSQATIETDLDFAKIVYQQQEIEIAKGDRLKWKKNDLDKNRRNGQEFSLVEIEAESALIQYPNGKLETIDLKEAQYLDYAWVSTTYSSQGKTSNNVLMLADNLDRESFYVGLSRGKYGLSVYTDDLEYLTKNANQSRARETALEALERGERVVEVEKVPVNANKGKTAPNSPSNSDTEIETDPAVEPGQKQPDSTEFELNTPKITSKPQIKPQTNRAVPQPILLSPIHKLARQKIDEINAKLDRLNSLEDRERGFEKEYNRAANNLAAWQAVCQLSVGAKVEKITTKGANQGTITDFYTNKDYVAAWVDWGDNLPMLEDLSLLNCDNYQAIGLIVEQQRSSLRTDSLQGKSHLSKTERTSNKEDFTNVGSEIRSVERNQVEGNASFGKSRETVTAQLDFQNQIKQQYQSPSHQNRIRCQEWERRNDLLRATPIETLIEQLGLIQDKSDRHKWKLKVGKSTVAAITIKESTQEFYDHLNLKGGRGAIDLVMHVRGCNFIEAVNWLDGGSILDSNYSHLSPVRSPSQPEKPQKCQIRDPKSWQLVRTYLVNKRKIPAELIDRLHNIGLIDADINQNAMFFRHEIEANFTRGKAIGVSLRSATGSWKGLSAGTKKDRCQFWFANKEGPPERIIVTEAPIDALSFAAKDLNDTRTTLYLSKDGSGPIPVAEFEKVLARGGEIIVATDNDRAGELLAWKIAEQIPSITRVKPEPEYKDWNDQLRNLAAQELAQIKNWNQIAAAVGKSESQREQIDRIVAPYENSQQLSSEDEAVFIKDSDRYRSIQNDLWKWLKTANRLNFSDEYKAKLIESAIGFNKPQPIPLTEEIHSLMKSDLKYNYVRQQADYSTIYQETAANLDSAESFNSRQQDLAIAMRLMRNYQATEIKKILQFSPQLREFPEVGDRDNQKRKHTSSLDKQQYVEEIYQLAATKRQQIALHNKRAISHWLEEYGTTLANGAVIYQDKDWCLSSQENTISIRRNATDTFVFQVNEEKVIIYQINEVEQSKLQKLIQKFKEFERIKQQNKRKNYDRER